MGDNHSLSDKVFHKLQEDILSGKYAVDEELKEKTIGDELGVSRTPVREALRQLELQGLVTITPNKGAHVTGFSKEDLNDIYEIRSVMEGLCAKWAAKKATPEQIEELEEIVYLTEFHVSKGHSEQVFELDNKFHEAILDLVSFMRLKKAWEDLNYGNIVMGYNMAVDSDQVIKRQYLIHEKLLSACRTGTPAQVEQAIADHYLGSVEKLIQKVEKKHEK